jgi:hypothetical protein
LQKARKINGIFNDLRVIFKRMIFQFLFSFFLCKVQNFSGFGSNKDRDTLIRNAHIERQKREQARKEQNNAIIVQAFTRSYLERKKLKNKLLNEYETYMKTQSLKNLRDLEYLLKRLIYFYSIDDGERLVITQLNYVDIFDIHELQNFTDHFVSIHHQEFSGNLG